MTPATAFVRDLALAAALPPAHLLVGHTLGRLACAPHWFHPRTWTAAKRLRAASSRAACARHAEGGEAP